MTVSAPAIPQSIARAWQLLQQGNHAAADEIVRPLLLLLTLPLAVSLIRTVFTVEGRPLNLALGGTGRLHMLFGVLLTIGLLL